MDAGSTSAASLLREIRTREGRSLRHAARDIGVAPSHLSRIERGERVLGPVLEKRLAEYYGLSDEQLDALDGRIPNDVRQILLTHPEEIKRLREIYGNDPEDDPLE